MVRNQRVHELSLVETHLDPRQHTKPPILFGAHAENEAKCALLAPVVSDWNEHERHGFKPNVLEGKAPSQRYRVSDTHYARINALYDARYGRESECDRVTQGGCDRDGDDRIRLRGKVRAFGRVASAIGGSSIAG